LPAPSLSRRNQAKSALHATGGEPPYQSTQRGSRQGDADAENASFEAHHLGAGFSPAQRDCKGRPLILPPTIKPVELPASFPP
jgi:hypothetical protein